MNSFIQIMQPDFKTQLIMPLNFCKLAKEDFAPNAEIRTCLGNWKVEVGKLKSEGGFYFHGVGWETFVEKHDLRECDGVVFLHRGSFRFDATFYSPSGSLKPVPPLPNPNVASQQRANNPTFTRVLSALSGADFHSRSTSRLYLPSKIWIDNPDFVNKTKAVLRLSGLYTREWRAKMAYYTGVYDRFAVGEGWYDFACFNGIKKGHSCKFEIIPDASTTLGYSHKTIIIIVTKLSPVKVERD